MSDQSTTDQLYFGKYKTLEDAEKGYKNAEKAIHKNAELSQRIDELTTIPEDYILPTGVESLAEVNELKTLARQAGLPQGAFDKLAQGAYDKAKTRMKQMDEAKKALGEGQINLLEEYVNKNYPPKTASVVMKQLILDNDARTEALAHREATLNTSIPGSNLATIGTKNGVTQDDVIKARTEAMKKPHDQALRARYLEITRQMAGQKQ